MKPLELKTYPLAFPNADSTLYLVGSGTSVYIEASLHAKRLTDAEAAAEYWASDSECQAAWMDGEHDEAMQARFETIERFATLPHASETNYE